jgi:ribosomal-protein-serine acetyltransferase
MPVIMNGNGIDMASQVYLQDGVVAIRPFHKSDLKPAYAAVRESQAEVYDWLPDLRDLTESEVLEYIAAQPQAWANHEAYNFIVLEHETGEMLGGCGLTQINSRHRFANLYYWVRTGRTGEGIATRAVRLAARFGLEFLKLHRVEIVVALENRPSLRVAEKSGAQREGLLRQRIVIDDRSYDAVMFSFVSGDFG